MEHLNLSAALSGLSPVAINEVRVLNPRVAQIVISSFSTRNTDALVTALRERLGGGLTPVRASFRWLDHERTAAMGFVARTPEIRDLGKSEPVTAGFRLVASNMYLSDSDKSTWEMKTTGSGAYMVRHGDEDLAELLEASRSPSRSGAPRMATMASVSVQPHEIVAFVNASGSTTPAMDYGFCLAVKDGQYHVLSSSSGSAVRVAADSVVSAHTLDSKEIHALYTSGAQKANIKASAYDKSGSIEYYKKLYSYAPDYVAKVVQEINEMAAL